MMGFKQTFEDAKKRAEMVAAEKKRQADERAQVLRENNERGTDWLKSVVLPILHEARTDLKGQVDVKIDESSLSGRLKPELRFTLTKVHITRGDKSVGFAYSVTEGKDVTVHTLLGHIESDLIQFNGEIQHYEPKQVRKLVSLAIDRLFPSSG